MSDRDDYSMQDTGTSREREPYGWKIGIKPKTEQFKEE